MQPKMKYEKEHQAVCSKLSNKITGYSAVNSWLASRTYCAMVLSSGTPIWPIEKMEFFQYNSNAKRAYTDSLEKAIAWSKGWIPWELRNAQLIPFEEYNKMYKSEEIAFYKTHESKYRNKQAILDYENTKNECYFMLNETTDFKVQDLRKYWNMDSQRYVF